MTRQKPIRVLIAKAGLDGHERGALVVALGLRDKGMEVIYTGLRGTPEEVANAAIAEAVDVIGVSSLSGAHTKFISKLVKIAKEKGLSMDDVLLIVGGIIPAEDAPVLKGMGASAIFGPGTSIEEIDSYIRKSVNR